MEQNGRVIFVDDDGSVLRSLRRGLRMHYKNWEMIFEESPEAALQHLREFDAWVIVSDKKMQELDGAVFLEQASREAPQAIRVLLSGDISDETALASAQSAHFLLPKPFELGDLIDVLERSVCLRSLPISLVQRQQIGQLKNLPVLPHIYQELTAYINGTEEPDNSEVAKIIGQDLGIMSKLLQVANSSFFGASSSVSDVEGALVRLGYDLVKQIILCVGLFSASVKISDDLEETGENLLHHSERVAGVMKDLAESAGLDNKEVRRAYLVGLLHQVGELVDTHEQIDHSEMVGGYLLQLWGFDNELVEAVLFQKEPERQAVLTQLTCFLFLAKSVVKAGSSHELMVDFSSENTDKLIDKANVGAYFRE